MLKLGALPPEPLLNCLWVNELIVDEPKCFRLSVLLVLQQLILYMYAADGISGSASVRLLRLRQTCAVLQNTNNCSAVIAARAVLC